MGDVRIAIKGECEIHLKVLGGIYIGNFFCVYYNVAADQIVGFHKYKMTM